MMFTLSINLEDAEDVSELATIAEIVQKGKNASLSADNILSATDWYLTKLVFAVQAHKYCSLEVDELELLIQRTKNSTKQLEDVLSEMNSPDIVQPA